MEALGCDGAARDKRVAVIPGAGFGVVFGEAMAAHVAGRLRDATWLRLSLASSNDGSSAGALRSMAAVLAGGGYAVEKGRLARRGIAFRSWLTRRRFRAPLKMGALAVALASLGVGMFA